MDGTTTTVTWQVADEATQSSGRRVSRAVEIAAYWMPLWQPLIRGSIGQPVRIVVAASDAASDVRRDDTGIEITIALPDTSAHASAPIMATALLDAALTGLETAAEQWPRQHPETLPIHNDAADGGLHGPILSVANLQPEELLLITGLPERSDSGEAAFHALDEYLIACVNDAGVGLVDDLTIDDPFIEWTIVLDRR